MTKSFKHFGLGINILVFSMFNFSAIDKL